MKKLLVIVSIFAISIFTGCKSSVTGEVVSAQTEIKQVSVQDASEAVKKENIQFIDVRTVEEYQSGHAPKVVNIPLDTLEKELSKLDKNKPVYVICATGRRSQKGAEILQKQDFKQLYNIIGGTSAWISAGLPTEK